MNNIFQRIFWVALLICIKGFLPGCSGQQETDKENKESKPEPQVILKPGSSFQDTLIVNTRSVVFFNADSVQQEKFSKVISVGSFESIKHDCFYQMGNVRTVIKNDWPKVEVNEAFNKRYVLFIKRDGSKVYIDLDKLDVCGVILFNGIKDPQTVDMTNIETELRYYFDF